jgi:hypothetical protein
VSYRDKPHVGPDGRIRDERFREGVGRDVIRAPTFVDWTNTIFSVDELEAEFNEIVDCLLEGKLIPEKYYRHRIEHSPDALLASEGIKHLHLGGRDSEIILFLVEYEDRVVLLEANDHRHFASKPEGSLLLSLHHACLRAEDADAAQRKTLRINEKRAIIRDALRAKRGSKDPA